MTADTRFAETAVSLGYAFDGELRIGGNYLPLVRDGGTVKNASVELDLIASVATDSVSVGRA